MDAEWMSAAFLVIDHTMEQRGHRSDARAQEPDQTRSPSPWSPRTTSRTITTGIARDAPAPVAVWVAAQLALQPAAAPDPPRSGLRADRNDVRSVVLRHNASDEGLRSPAPACGSGGARVRACEACSRHETLHRSYVLSALKPHGVGVRGHPHHGSDELDIRTYRRAIETVNSQAEKMGSQQLHVRTDVGFELKVIASLIALAITNAD